MSERGSGNGGDVRLHDDIVQGEREKDIFPMPLSVVLGGVNGVSVQQTVMRKALVYLAHTISGLINPLDKDSGGKLIKIWTKFPQRPQSLVTAPPFAVTSLGHAIGQTASKLADLLVLLL